MPPPSRSAPPASAAQPRRGGKTQQGARQLPRSGGRSQQGTQGGKSVTPPPAPAAPPPAAPAAAPATSGGRTVRITSEGSGALLALFLYPFAVALIKGGPSMAWGWVKAKFINQPYGAPPPSPNTTGVGTPPGKIPGAGKGHQGGRKK